MQLNQDSKGVVQPVVPDVATPASPGFAGQISETVKPAGVTRRGIWMTPVGMARTYYECSSRSAEYRLSLSWSAVARIVGCAWTGSDRLSSHRSAGGGVTCGDRDACGCVSCGGDVNGGRDVCRRPECLHTCMEYGAQGPSGCSGLQGHALPPDVEEQKVAVAWR